MSKAVKKGSLRLGNVIMGVFEKEVTYDNKTTNKTSFSIQQFYKDKDKKTQYSSFLDEGQLMKAAYLIDKYFSTRAKIEGAKAPAPEKPPPPQSDDPFDNYDTGGDINELPF